MNEKYFEKAVKEWIEYLKNSTVLASSNSRSITECEAYEKILSMHYKALPLIRKLYDRDSSDNFSLSCIKGHGLVQLVHEIIGDGFQIPEDIRGRIKKIENYTKNWLDKNMDKYIN